LNNIGYQKYIDGIDAVYIFLENLKSEDDKINPDKWRSLPACR